MHVHRGGKTRVLGLLGAVLLLSGIAIATEPDGVVGLRPEWVETPADSAAGSTRFLDLGILPSTPLQDAQLVVEVPPGAEWLGRTTGLAIETVEETVAPDGTRWIRIRLGDFAAPRVIRLAFAHAEQSGAVVSLRVEAVGPHGPVTEAAGVAVGHPGAPAVVRHGAREYRAVPRPEEAP